MRITQSFRDGIHRAALKNLPQVNYLKQLHELVQSVLVENAPEICQAVYADPEAQRYLERHHVYLKNGNRYLTLHYLSLSTRSLDVRLDDASFAHYKEGTIEYKIADALRKSGLFQKYLEQESLYASVSERLKQNLKQATTYKSLFSVLEPELHQFIPPAPATQPKSQLPTLFAPVVSDMERLGAVFEEKTGA
jgi:hypothetical protein